VLHRPSGSPYRVQADRKAASLSLGPERVSAARALFLSCVYTACRVQGDPGGRIGEVSLGLDYRWDMCYFLPHGRQRMKEKETMKLVVAAVPKAHIRAIKVKAAKAGRTMASLVREMIAREVKS
jgi:hypothetical protein